MKKAAVLLAKLAVLLALVGFVGGEMAKNWKKAQPGDAALTIDWRFAPLAMAGFVGVMLTSGLVWRWLAARMNHRGRTLPLLGAYTFSQMGKYMPGKVLLLVMRIERTKRLGMDLQTCTLSTLVENAMYMVSGGLVAAGTLALVARDKPQYLAATLVSMALLLVVFHPKVFFRLLNGGLKKFKQPPLDHQLRLRKRDLATAVGLFLPCWLCGGIGLWASLRCLAPVSPLECWALPGAFAFSVIGGMASLLPGGLGVRELILALFVAPILVPHLGDSRAQKAALIAAALQRLFQITVEVLLGLTGALAARTPAPAPQPANA